MNYKVSVVIPIYKVERYIKRCIDSVLNQTYTNLQIIMIDDGSPDKCGKIADGYARKDSRITVFHKVNGGLSEARNYGMKHAIGEFTIFVDSDDWMKSEMIETMVKLSIKYNADIVQTGFYYAYDDYLLFDERFYGGNTEPIILYNESLMSELVVNEKVKNFAWGKLYRTELIKDIPFKRGVLFEDVFWAHKVMHRVDRYVVINNLQFYYYQREDSIVSNYTPRNLDIIKGLKERHYFIENYYRHLVDKSFRLILKTCLSHYNLLSLNKGTDNNGVYRKEIERYVRSNYEGFKKSTKDSSFLRVQLNIFSICPTMYNFIIFMARFIGRLNIFRQNKGLQRIDI